MGACGIVAAVLLVRRVPVRAGAVELGAVAQPLFVEVDAVDPGRHAGGVEVQRQAGGILADRHRAQLGPVAALEEEGRRRGGRVIARRHGGIGRIGARHIVGDRDIFSGCLAFHAGGKRDAARGDGEDEGRKAGHGVFLWVSGWRITGRTRLIDGRLRAIATVPVLAASASCGPADFDPPVLHFAHPVGGGDDRPALAISAQCHRALRNAQPGEIIARDPRPPPR